MPLAPLAALVGAGVAVADGIDSDIRAGLFPWGIALAASCLVLCSFGVINVHHRHRSWWVIAGGWWTAAAMAGFAFFWASVGFGSVLGLEEDQLGLLAWVPFLSVVFAILSITPAMVVLGVGATSAHVLPWWGTSAIWIAAPVVPLIASSGGLFEGTAENVGFIGLMTLFGIAWVVVGASLRRQVVQ